MYDAGPVVESTMPMRTGSPAACAAGMTRDMPIAAAAPARRVLTRTINFMAVSDMYFSLNQTTSRSDAWLAAAS
jgi:hypothetical protein